MHYLLTLPLLLGLSLPVQAGLGDAETKETVFDAWCGKKGNDCKVVFTDETLTVNGTDGINRSQILGFTWNYLGPHQVNWTHQVRYTFVVTFKEDGVDKRGTFIFQNKGAADNFRQAITVLCSKCKPTYNINF